MSKNPMTVQYLIETLECMNHIYTDAEHYAKFHKEIVDAYTNLQAKVELLENRGST